MANNWRQLVDVLNTLPGPSFEQDQQLPEGVLQGTLSMPLSLPAHYYLELVLPDPSPRSSARTHAVGGATGASKVHLVFFIGGVTFTEIAAIRWLSQQDGTHSRP
jgi:hypothetical protein